MKKEYLFAGISILCWGTTASVTKLLLGSMENMQVLAVGFFFAFAFLLVLNLAKGNLRQLKKLKLSDFLFLTGMSLLGIFLYTLFLNIGIARMQASQAFIINYLWPMMSVVFACLILKEKLTFRKLIAIFCSFLGVVIVTTNGKLGGFDPAHLTGALFCILAAVSYGLFTVLNKRSQLDKTLCMMVYYGISFLISAVCMAVMKLPLQLDLPQTLGLLWLGIGTNAIPYVTWALALQYGDTAKISNLAYCTPFLSLLWNFLLLKESLSIWSVLGLLVIVSGIFIQMGEKQKKEL